MSNTTPQVTAAPQALAKKTEDPASAMKRWISASSKAFAKILPRHVTEERFVKVCHAMITKTPKLADCEPRDLVMALVACAEMGLEPNTPLQHVHIIPFTNKRRGVVEPQVIVGYQGYLALIHRSHQVKSLTCEVVREHDDFDCVLGSEPYITHRPREKRDADDRMTRGDVAAAYMTARIGDAVQIEYMGLGELLEARNGSQGYQSAVRYGKPHPWLDSFAAMCRKTVLRRGQKWLPKCTEEAERLASAAATDERHERGESSVIDVDVIGDLPRELREQIETPSEGSQADRLADRIGEAMTLATATETADDSRSDFQ